MFHPNKLQHCKFTAVASSKYNKIRILTTIYSQERSAIPMYYFSKALFKLINFGGNYMKKQSSIFLVFTLVFCLFLTGCNKTNVNSKLPSNSQISTQNEQTALTIPNENVMVNYYGMTIQDVIDIWGEDYVLSDHLLDAAFASIYYNDSRCPFEFYYKANYIPTDCDVNAKITGIQTKISSNDTNFFVTKNLCISTSYNIVSQQLEGEYYPDEMWSGNTFECTTLKNVDVVYFTWTNDEDIPWRILMHFIGN